MLDRALIALELPTNAVSLWSSPLYMKLYSYDIPILKEISPMVVAIDVMLSQSCSAISLTILLSKPSLMNLSVKAEVK